jgi:hypothetical protein
MNNLSEIQKTFFVTLIMLITILILLIIDMCKNDSSSLITKIYPKIYPTIFTNMSFKDYLLNLSNPNSYINQYTMPFLLELVKSATNDSYNGTVRYKF